MNLYIRLVRVMLAALFGRKIDILGESAVHFRVWPNDLDANIHMNNGRYLTLMDLGRFDLVVRGQLMGLAMKRGWMPVLAGATIRYRRSLAPFQRFVLRTRLVCWDERWFFIEQRFESMDGKLAALAVVKGCFKGRGGVVPTAQVLAAAGRHDPSPAMPEAIRAWVAADDEMAGAAERLAA